MNIDEFYKMCNFISSKVKGGYISPDEFNQTINVAQRTLFIKKLGNPAEYRPFDATPRVAYAVTERIEGDLRPFVGEASLQIDVGNRVNIPTDLAQCISMDYNGNNIDLVRIADERNRVSSVLVPPNSEYPIAVFYQTQIQFYGLLLGQIVRMKYLRYPSTALWAFTLNVNNRPIYNSNASQDHQFQNLAENELMIEVLSLWGIHLDDGNLSQYTSAMKQEGI